jgi:hypothetical protein
VGRALRPCASCRRPLPHRGRNRRCDVPPLPLFRKRGGLGCANQAGEDNRNVARMAALLAGLPESRGQSRSTACAARAGRVGTAARAIKAGEAAFDDCRRRGEHEPRAFRDAQGRERFFAQHPRRHHDGLALRQPAHEGALRHRFHARDGRECRAGVQHRARGPGPFRAGQPAQGAGRAEERPGCSTPRWCR